MFASLAFFSCLRVAHLADVKDISFNVFSGHTVRPEALIRAQYGIPCDGAVGSCYRPLRGKTCPCQVSSVVKC